MIKNWLVRGDCHGQFTWMDNGCLDKYEPEETAIIVLGDCGFDFYLNKTDTRKKREIDAKGYYIYWLRGNHEARPSDIPDYDIISDPKDTDGKMIKCRDIIGSLDGVYNSKSLAQNIICQYVFWQRLESRINIKQCLNEGRNDCM